MNTAEIGSVSSGTLRTADLLCAFSSELDRLDEEGKYKALIVEANRIAEIDLDDDAAHEAAGWLIDDIVDALQDFAPEGTIFGSHEGDSADFGFWSIEEGL